VRVDGFAHSAGKHGVSKGRARQVIANPTVTLILPAPSPGKDERMVWLGADSTGRVLEVVTVPSDKGGLYVIHAKDIRARFRRYYDAAVEDE